MLVVQLMVLRDKLEWEISSFQSHDFYTLLGMERTTNRKRLRRAYEHLIETHAHSIGTSEVAAPSV